ncbi:hypothetical protein [Sorangium sp. So ce590]|uniref:hypothetical protein n=1 Tax=unclassified Sorangium TaxID=2621164 RepID=UPI003F5E530E
MILSDPSNDAIALGLIVLAHAPAILGSRKEIIKIRDQFREWVFARAAGKKDLEAPEINPAFAEEPVATIGVISGPDVLLASSILATAIEQAVKMNKDAALAEQQGKVLREALREAMELISCEGTTIDPSERLYQAAIERLSKAEK